MKTIGLLGGMSWESTTQYYRLINQGIKKKLGGWHSAKIALYSVDFAPLEKLQHKDDWQGTADILIEGALKVQAAGADFLLICTNTMHKVAPEIEAALSIPVLHIADATAEVLKTKNVKRVGLLGTAFTMEQPFYKDRLTKKFGIEVVIPNKDDRAIVHNVIYDELCQGKILEESRQQYLRIIEELSTQGAEAVILGCTEIGILVQQTQTKVPIIDTTVIHAEEAVEFALSE